MLIKRVVIGAFAGLALGPVALSDVMPTTVYPESNNTLPVVQNTALAPTLSPITPAEAVLAQKVDPVRGKTSNGTERAPAPGLKRRVVVVTAYSSTPDQTDATPFITASGTLVRDGIVAANWLPMGSYVRLPELYGEKVFVVEDRMHPKNAHKVDVWMPTRQDAKNFGVRRTKVEVF